MKIEIPKQELEAALSVVNFGVGSSGALSGLTTHYVFRYLPEQSLVEILANNGRVAAAMPIRANVSSVGDATSFTVEAWRLNKWVAAVEPSVLSLEFKDNIVVATSPKGSVKFQSLDPSGFPYWDEMYKSSEPTMTISAKQLQGALSHSKQFLSDRDTTRPNFTVTEIRNGSMLATDIGALSMISCPEFKGSSLRINRKDVPKVISFLSSCGDLGIEVREHTKCAFLVREDTGLLSVGRPRHEFPDFELDKKPYDPFWWEFKTEDLRSGINTLISSAAKEDTRVTFNRVGDQVFLSMASANGDPVQVALTPEEIGETTEETLQDLVDQGSLTENAAKQALGNIFPIPDEGFVLAHPYLTKLLSQYKSDTIKLGISPHIDEEGVSSGWVRCQETRDGVEYTTLVVWLV
jgi:hypothetical protein